MPDKSEKAGRKQILRSQREERRRAVREGLPVAPPVLQALFDHIDSRLSSNDCDNTLRFAREFILDNHLPEDLVLVWLEGNGGYCDCEVISNAEQVFEDAVPGDDDLPRA